MWVCVVLNGEYEFFPGYDLLLSKSSQSRRKAVSLHSLLLMQC